MDVLGLLGLVASNFFGRRASCINNVDPTGEDCFKIVGGACNIGGDDDDGDGDDDDFDGNGDLFVAVTCNPPPGVMAVVLIVVGMVLRLRVP